MAKAAPGADGAQLIGRPGEPVTLRHTLLWEHTRVWPSPVPALFVAFAPVEAPRIAVAVIVENGSSGSRVAAPIARAIMDAYLGYGDDAP